MPARPAAKAAKKTVKTKPAKPAAKPAAKASAKATPAKPRVKAKPLLAKRTVANAAPHKRAAVKVASAKRAPLAKAAARPPAKPKPAPPVKLTPELLKFREMLFSERARLEIELEEIESRTARTTDAERATELSSYEDHPADLASETFEREKDLAIAESVESLLNQVNTALEKVERGTYGTCDACGRPIKRARLQALPFATLCLECQDRLEG